MSDNDDLYQKRDLIMQRILDNSEYLKEKIDLHKREFEEHVKEDKEFQDEINKKISWGIKIAVAVLIIVAANGGLSAIKELIHI